MINFYVLLMVLRLVDADWILYYSGFFDWDFTSKDGWERSDGATA